MTTKFQCCPSPPEAFEIETFVMERVAASGRSCGTCSLCGYVLRIDHLEKPSNEWCRHCHPGHGGCSIYAQRPQVCRSFACAWLVTTTMGERWFPRRAKMVCHFTYGNELEHERGTMTLQVNVDRRYPNRWREEPYFGERVANVEARPAQQRRAEILCQNLRRRATLCPARRAHPCARHRHAGHGGATGTGPVGTLSRWKRRWERC
jgi:Fe-S-cluster containining protein